MVIGEVPGRTPRFPSLLYFTIKRAKLQAEFGSRPARWVCQNLAGKRFFCYYVIFFAPFAVTLFYRKRRKRIGSVHRVVGKIGKIQIQVLARMGHHEIEPPSFSVASDSICSVTNCVFLPNLNKKRPILPTSL